MASPLSQVQKKTSGNSPVQKKKGRQESSSAIQLKGMSFSEQQAALAPGAQGFDVQRQALLPVQQQGGGGTENVHAAAERGTSGGGGALPYLQKIQSSFGAHDVSNVQAYSGGAAKEASAAMGAEAYATGNKIAFGSSPGLHTAAHEAAHIVQQRAGVSLSGGVGQAGDSYEQHADAVADAVVQGKSAEGILDKMAGNTAAVQTKKIQQKKVQQKKAGVQRKPAVQMSPRPLPGGAQVVTTNGNPDGVISGMNRMASGFIKDADINFHNRAIGERITAVLASGNFSAASLSFNELETEGLNTKWIGNVRFRIDNIRQIGGGTGAQTTGGGGTSSHGSGQSNSQTDSASVTGSVGGHEGAPGAEATAGTSSTETRTRNSGGTGSNQTSSTTQDNIIRYQADIIVIVDMKHERDISGSDYINPFKWGVAAADAVVNPGTRTRRFSGGNVIYQQSAGIR